MSSYRLIRGIINQYSQNRAKIPNDFKQERKMQPPLKQQSQKNQQSQKSNIYGTKDYKYDLEIEESGNYILQTWLLGFPKTKNKSEKSD